MLAALLYFRTEFREVFRDLPEYLEKTATMKSVPDNYTLLNYLIISTVLTGVLGGMIYIFGLQYLPENPDIFTVIVGVALLVTGGMKLAGNGSNRDYSEADKKDSVFVGVLQGLAIIPGVSRSGTTVFGLFYRDFSTDDAFKLSFLMSVPAVLAAQIGLGILSGFSITDGLLAASVSSFVVGYLSIDAVLKLAERTEVAYLCFILAILSFLTLLI
jgi:undecaprenyl-diphosphatase